MEQLAMERLAQIFSATGQAIDFDVVANTGTGGQHWRWDAVIIGGGHRFVVECKSSGSLSHIAMAVGQLAEVPNHFPEPVIPLLAVPYMGKPHEPIVKSTTWPGWISPATGRSWRRECST